MAYLSKSYGFTPCWTSNLADHLKIDAEAKILMVYEHKICLLNHFECSGKNGTSYATQCPPMLPPNVVGEALDTLNLLFPFGDEATKALLEAHGKSATVYGLGTCGRQKQLEISGYVYWRKEIEEIAAILSQPPRGKAQFLLDRDGTNSREVWTFWTAIAFGALAVIGVATGVYSAMYARKAFDVDMLQYQLALAQACSAENATDELPDFCR